MKQTFVHPPCGRFWRFAVAAALLLFVAAPSEAQTNDSPKILFLQLRLKNDAIMLVKSSVRPGYLKPRPEPEVGDGIRFNLLSATGETLWKGAMPDPTVRVIEFEETPRSGKLTRKKLQFAEAEFTIRVPFRAEVRRIDFYKSQVSATDGQVTKKSLGSVTSPFDRVP